MSGREVHTEYMPKLCSDETCPLFSYVGKFNEVGVYPYGSKELVTSVYYTPASYARRSRPSPHQTVGGISSDPRLESYTFSEKDLEALLEASRPGQRPASSKYAIYFDSRSEEHVIVHL